jgi:hypothetical protein
VAKLICFKERKRPVTKLLLFSLKKNPLLQRFLFSGWKHLSQNYLMFRV